MSDKLYYCQSFRDDCGRVYLSKDGDFAWKLDVQDKQGNWHVPHGDHLESYVDEIMPYLKRFVDDRCQWFEHGTDQPVSFWQIVASEYDTAFPDN